MSDTTGNPSNVAALFDRYKERLRPKSARGLMAMAGNERRSSKPQPKTPEIEPPR